MLWDNENLGQGVCRRVIKPSINFLYQAHLMARLDLGVEAAIHYSQGVGRLALHSSLGRSLRRRRRRCLPHGTQMLPLSYSQVPGEMSVTVLAADEVSQVWSRCDVTGVC